MLEKNQSQDAVECPFSNKEIHEELANKIKVILNKTPDILEKVRLRRETIPDDFLDEVKLTEIEVKETPKEKPKHEDKTIQRVYDLMENKKNFFITGRAGCGKSFSLRHGIEAYEDDYNIARTAMTGAASLQLIGGETIHRCTGIGIYNNKASLKKITQSFRFQKEIIYELKSIDKLIIDEISMMRSDTMDLIDEVFKYARWNDEPFGGVQVILSGDYMQIPPVVKDNDLPNFWAFESEVWNKLNLEVINLTEIKRQTDIEFMNHLSLIRCGMVNEVTDNYFFNTHKHRFPVGIDPIRLLGTNEEVNRLNDKKLSVVQSEPEIYDAKIEAMDNFLRERIIKDCPAMVKLEVKHGCQVMILKNSPNGDYVNGSMGKFIGHDQGTEIDSKTGKSKVVEYLVVELYSNGREVFVPQHEWKIEKQHEKTKETLASFIQFPVKLGYALTIHKAQGMTVDYLEVDLMRCFGPGMAYVALSRAKTYEGLRVLNWNKNVVKCDTKAFNYYMNLRNKGLIST